ncbi:MAG TPA: hypothetical protein VL463_24120 [Kofleriaceae bacterium]|nr:hypothetical protein [Kofleriaceae bacterium]
MSSEHDVGFQEKSLWITLFANVLVYAYYFWRVLAIGRDPARVGVLFGQTVIALIVIMAAGHIVLAVRQKPERKDERDRTIAMRASRNAFYVLSTGAWAALGVAAMSFEPFWIAHAILGAIVLAEVTRTGSQLVYYRRGVA